MELTSLEARVIGCLLEKELTTPDQYPLSLNSLALACNQKSSREPVLSLSESQVKTVLDDLTKKRLLSEQSGFGSRVVKYKHRFCNTEFSELQLSSAEVAIICVLLLRGPQTPGELKTRTNRLHEFTDVSQVETALLALSQREKPLVVQLTREANKRDCRFLECFSGNVDDYDVNSSDAIVVSNHTQQTLQQDSKIVELEQRVELLELKLAQLESLLN
ncbi:YceH family protein [Shewanella frigidimarina]|uniref:YceH family protein n=1 Tax=Shewanella frigidimarina TaxID=56812 RepID=UPI003D794D50